MSVGEQNSPAEWHNLGLDVTGPERPVHLHSGDGMHGVRAADRVRARLRQADVLDLALLHQLLELTNLQRFRLKSPHEQPRQRAPI